MQRRKEGEEEWGEERRSSKEPHVEKEKKVCKAEVIRNGGKNRKDGS